ncbi:hypothetical protein [Infirmifilum sp.]|uniref:hypothetical protein n=1 Tax=Infirmifilum sp. TaxID=2856575 RepID=UPI003D0A67F3
MSSNRAVEALDIVMGVLGNYLHGLRQVPGEVIFKTLKYLAEAQFKNAVLDVDRFRALGLVRTDMMVDHAPLL